MKHLITRRAFWMFTMLFILVGALAACGSNPQQNHTFTGKLSLLQVPQPYSLPGKIFLGPDNNLWFPAVAYHNFGTSQPSGAIGRLSPDGTFHMFPLPKPNSYPTQIAIASDGTIWFTALQGNGQIRHGLDTPPSFTGGYGEYGKLTPDGTFSILSNPFHGTTNAYLSGIAIGPGNNIWLVEDYLASNNSWVYKIGLLSSAGGFTDFGLLSLQQYDTIGATIIGPDGNFWFAIDGSDSHYNAVGKMGRITSQGKLTIFSLGMFAVPLDLTIGPDNAIWLSTGRSTGSLSMDGKLHLYTPSENNNQNDPLSLGGITTGSDGAIWFATRNVAVGLVTTDGAFKFYPFPAGTNFDNGGSSLTLGELKGIVTGSDGTLWLTDNTQIGHFV